MSSSGAPHRRLEKNTPLAGASALQSGIRSRCPPPCLVLQGLLFTSVFFS